ncbi:hypothetical protein QYE76_048240, partial [Lolium multiflorum]
MEIIIALVDRTLVMMILAPTQGAESSIAMLVLMSVLNKNKLFTKIVLKRLAMPTMGMTTNPKTTSSTTWTRHLIVKPMWMLKTKVIKIHQGVTSGTILAMTKGAEDNLNMIKMREPTLDNVNNLDKIRNNILNMSQVKLVFTSNANPMLWNMEDEENMYGKLKFNMPKFKGEDDAEAYLSWALKVDKIFRIHNYSGAKKVAMASLEFEDYANTWWEQVVTLREEKGDPPIDTWEDMKEEMEARFVPKHYKTDLFNKLQKLKQGTKTVEEFFKEMELTMMRANIQESENQTIARFFNGLNYPIKRVVEFQQYSNMVELVHQASKAERQVNEDIKYSKSKQYFASKFATSTPTTSVKPTASSTPSKQPSIQSRMKQTVSSTASSKASTGPSNVTCFKCGTQGHKSFECKNTKVMITMENGDIETLSEGEYEALVQAAVANEEDYDEESGEDPLLCTHDPSPSLVVTRVLTTQPQAMEDQRCNIFQTRAGIGGKSIKVIIDGGSCHNLASTELCEKLNLTLRKHPHPYHVQWLSDKGNVKIQHTVTVNFKIGPYEDTVECDVVPMTVCHMLLGRPWQFDKKAIHDGFSNAYTFKVKDKKFELRPMTPSQIIADNAKALARAQHHIHHSELRGEGATHQKESERHHPHMSERKSVLLTTKSEWREVKDNPSTTIHYVLICKGLSAETNDLTNIPSSLLSLLKEFQDVFPDELPHGLPPLRGIEHRIDLIPGAPLPNRAAYRTNPEDTKEIQRQIQDLLAKGYQEETSIARGEEQLDMKTDDKMAVKLDMELDMKISHGRAREEREACARGEEEVQAGPEPDFQFSSKKPDDTPVTWREYEALRDHLSRELRVTTETFDTEIQGVNLKIRTMVQQQPQHPFDEDGSVNGDNADAAAQGMGRGVGRGLPRGVNRGFVEIGARRVPLQQDDGLGKPKFSIPRFEGGTDVEEYLTWELKIERLWRLHPDYTEDKKIKLASSEFDGYALRWWDALVQNREEDGELPIVTWRTMKAAMRARFVPTNYLRSVFDKLTQLKQGVLTVDAYYMEMEMLMQRARVRESLEMTMQRFLNGLKFNIKGIVRHHKYATMNELLHHAREAESQLAEEAQQRGRATGAGRYTPRPPPSTAPSTRPTDVPSSSSKPVSNVSHTKKPVPAASGTGSSMSTARNRDMVCHTCGGKGHFKRDCPNRKVMIINEDNEYETGDDADPDAPEDDDYDSDSFDAYPSEAQTIVVSQRVLNVQPSASTQRCNLFQTKALVGPDKACKVIIDGGSCRNLASKELCAKLKLKYLPHPHPYYIQWLSNNGEMKVSHMVRVDFEIGP